MSETQPDLFAGCLSFDTITTPRGDGSYIVRPGRVRRMESRVPVTVAARLTGYSVRQMRRIARELSAGQRRAGCKLWIPAPALQRMLEGKATGRG